MTEVPLAAASAATDCRFWVCCYCSSMEHYLAPYQYCRATSPPNNKPVGSFTVFGPEVTSACSETVYRVGVGVGVGVGVVE
jgi:hypothetical protein